jgi:hypothetical protein
MNMFRNMIRNGDMRIDTNFNGVAQSNITAVTSLMDGFGLENNWGTYVVQQVSDAPPAFNYSTKLTLQATAADNPGGVSLIHTTIDNYTMQELGFGTTNAKQIVVSFWVKTSVTGTYAFYVQPSWDGGRGYITTYTVSSANTWQKVVFVIPGDTAGSWTTNDFVITLGAGSAYNNTSSLNTWTTTANRYTTSSCVAFPKAAAGSTFQFTGVQIEKGSYPTPFEYRPFMLEQLLTSINTSGDMACVNLLETDLACIRTC